MELQVNIETKTHAHTQGMETYKDNPKKTQETTKTKENIKLIIMEL
jgi:hypothetical protein